MRLSHASVVLLALSAGGWTAYSSYERAQLSPFALWSVRAGAPFQEMDDLAFREMKHHFACRSANDGFRLCELATDGPPGVMRVAVDERGRAIYVQFLTADTTLMMREESRRLGADWNLVRRGVAVRASSGAPATRWETEDHRWSAEMRAGESALLPSSITLADERAFARVAERSVPTLLLLARHGIVSDAALAAVEHRSPGVLGRAADSLAGDARALAAAARALPLCAGVPVAPTAAAAGNYDPNGPAIAMLAPERTAIAAQAIARAYPGVRLEMVGLSSYLVDASGGWEEVRLIPNAASEDGRRYAFALSFPARSTAVESRSVARDTTGRCRAPAEVLVADVDPATQSVAGLQRVDVDGEALSARVMTVNFARSGDDRPALVVGYDAVYGVAAWRGEVRWHELIALGDAAPAVVRRVPQAGMRSDDRPGVTAALFVPDDPVGDDPFGFTEDASAVRRMAVFDPDEPYPHLAPAKRLVLPPGPNGVPSGWSLLDLL
ncbi:MAG TPA: hypothetical protein VFJ74_07125 [Gemmatimonadaceae bacterium]|nr:hypothetical protein [Gemmatimonadaceae bacterium]